MPDDYLRPISTTDSSKTSELERSSTDEPPKRGRGRPRGKARARDASAMVARLLRIVDRAARHLDARQKKTGFLDDEDRRALATLATATQTLLRSESMMAEDDAAAVRKMSDQALLEAGGGRKTRFVSGGDKE